MRHWLMMDWLMIHSLNSHSLISQEALVLLLCLLESIIPSVAVVGETIDLLLADPP